MMRWLGGAVFLLILLWLLSMSAWGQFGYPHHHPTETITGATARFYESWMRPDMPTHSCCDQKDCYPTSAKQIGGTWFAQRREDRQWLAVPQTRVEIHRDSPDGRSHLCAPPPEQGNMVFCFLPASGS